MCFGADDPPPQEAPAPAAPPPSPTAGNSAASVGSVRRNEDLALFGSSNPSLRVDRSATAGGVGQGGSGLRTSGQ